MVTSSSNNNDTMMDCDDGGSLPKGGENGTWGNTSSPTDQEEETK